MDRIENWTKIKANGQGRINWTKMVEPRRENKELYNNMHMYYICN